MSFIKCYLLFSSTVLIHCHDLTNITESVFGRDQDSGAFLPAAFGDFNSDKLTDLVVLKNGRVTLQVLLATQQKVVSSGSDPPVFQAASGQALECNAPEGTIVSAVPTDLDGDGGMDMVVVTRKGTGSNLHVMWGEGGGTRIECRKGALEVDNLVGQPTVFDYNGDYVSDLLLVDREGKRLVYKFSRKRSFEIVELPTEKRAALKSEHFNAWLDLSGDGAADLLLSTQTGLELYLGPHYSYHGEVAWPAVQGDCTVDKCVGQAVFTDFDLDGQLDMLLPLCFDLDCLNSSLYLVPVSELWAAAAGGLNTTTPWNWEPMSLELGEMRFVPSDPSLSPLALLSPRVGDVDLDGWPDLVVNLYNSSLGSVTRLSRPHLLLNTPCGRYSGCRPFWRQYQLQAEFTRGTGERSSVAAAFFDIHDDGNLDLLVVEGGGGEAGHRVTAFRNTTQDSDAYFMKVQVLTGSCFHNCPNKSSSYLPYGTNTGGQLVSYQSQRPGPETFDSYKSVAAQLPQTAHLALQLPYIIFGLGMSPNFVDYMTVNNSAGSHSWPQIIPNSQLYVIPFGPPSNWEAKLVILTSKNIVMTGLSLVGCCALISCIIVGLHLRERRADLQAKLAEANRFHFDAM